jgi:hypothetical protein
MRRVPAGVPSAQPSLCCSRPVLPPRRQCRSHRQSAGKHRQRGASGWLEAVGECRRAHCSGAARPCFPALGPLTAARAQPRSGAGKRTARVQRRSTSTAARLLRCGAMLMQGHSASAWRCDVKRRSSPSAVVLHAGRGWSAARLPATPLASFPCAQPARRIGPPSPRPRRTLVRHRGCRRACEGTPAARSTAAAAGMCAVDL